MDLADLHVFRTVVESGGITAAADRLHRVQSNVTTRVKQLEESLGVALFQRDSRKMTLTPEGHRLLGYAEQMLTLAEEARQSMRLSAPSGTLRVGSMESSAATLLPKPLGQFHAAWPDVELTLSTGTTGYLVDAVLGHRIDLSRTPAPQQLHLEMVQRCDIGEAMGDRAGQRGIVGQPVFVAGDGFQPLDERFRPVKVRDERRELVERMAAPAAARLVTILE